jgi:FkbM family methyltransferase
VALLPSRVASKPQYVFHPGRAAKRVLHRFGNREGRAQVTRLPWDLPLEVYTSDAIGFAIVTGRVFDPCVTETLHRLIDPGDVVADVGANLGYMTSLAAARVGDEGKVLAFEPHPRAYELLERNAARWRELESVGAVELNRVALSDAAGEGTLVSGGTSEFDMAVASLRDEGSASPHGGSDTVPVRLARLDEIAGEQRLGLVKIDVEGHEADVLRGAGGLLASGAIRDIVFEDHDDYPSEATSVVADAGYELISLDNDLWGLRLVAPEDRGEVPAWPGPSYLATREPARARERLGRRGWQVSGIGPGLGARRRVAS